MDALVDATDAQMAILADLTASLAAAEQTLSSMLAARDGMLAMAARLAVEIAQQADHADKGDLTVRTIAAEIGAAQRTADRTIERRMNDATVLVERFPLVWQAQGAGRITAAHTRVILDAGARLTEAAERDAFTAQVLPIAEAESPNRLRRHARRIVEGVQRRTMAERHRDARRNRHVRMRDVEDGMSELTLHAPATLVHGIHDRLTGMARSLHASGEEELGDADGRTVHQLRADLAAELLLTGHPTAHDTPDGVLAGMTAHVQVTIPVLTLLDHQADADGAVTPAELDGTTPIDPETARVLAGHAPGWDRVLTHPITGALLAVDRYRPDARLRRHLRARDQRCRFPGCGHPARDCDLDHNRPASAGGATRHDNLAAFCRRHHRLKHHSPWHVEQLRSGRLRWTSPTGRTYDDEPPPPHADTFAAAPPETAPAPF